MITSSPLEELPRKKHFSTVEIKKALREYGNPQEGYETILIAGTNGKGSTTAFLSSILSHRYRVGSYYSPHVEFFNERIVVDGKAIEDDEWRSWEGEALKAAKRYNLSPFEAITLMAFLYFDEAGVDKAVMEVGLGGLYDATNVAPNTIAIITPISKDHTDYFGTSIKAIAREKAGIIKQNSYVVFAGGKGKSVVEKVAKQNHAELYTYGKSFRSAEVSLSLSSTSFTYMGEKQRGLSSSLLGTHQALNASLAVKAAELLGMSDYAIEKGVKRAFLKARFELLSTSPPIVLDGAHNPAGFEALFATYNSLFNEPPILLFAVMRDKAWRKMLSIASESVDEVIATDLPMERSLNKEKIAKMTGGLALPLEEALREALSKAKLFHKPLLISGSLYLAGALRGKLRLSLL